MEEQTIETCFDTLTSKIIDVINIEMHILQKNVNVHRLKLSCTSSKVTYYLSYRKLSFEVSEF